MLIICYTLRRSYKCTEMSLMFVMSVMFITFCARIASKEGPSLYDRSSCDRNHRSRVVLLSLTLILIALLLHL
jgi:hypothetical protein